MKGISVTELKFQDMMYAVAVLRECKRARHILYNALISMALLNILQTCY